MHDYDTNGVRPLVRCFEDGTALIITDNTGLRGWFFLDEALVDQVVEAVIASRLTALVGDDV